MSDRRFSPRIVILLSLVLALVAASPPVAAAQPDQEALLQQVKDLMETRGVTRFVMPIPGSRSSVMSVDTSTPLFFFLERGSIRGSAINDFYSAYESGDVETAYSAFLSSAIMVLRVTDYGWNGLGNPMVTDSGSEIGDILFKDVGGVFARSADISADDVGVFVGMLETLVAALEGTS